MKKQNQFTSLIALALIVFAAIACGNSGNESSTSGGNPSGSPSAPSGGSADLSTPTRTHAALYQAMKTRDLNLYKRVSSKCYLDQMVASAKQQNISLDEFVKNSINVVPAASISTPEVRGEKISGDKATLEEKDFRNNGDWNKIPFVKEDGDWKYNFLCD